MNAITTMSKTPLRQVKSVGELLWNEAARQQLATVAARHMSPERLMRVVANAIRTTPKLQECDPLSMLGALMQCATLGLEPNTVLGHAYLIPFENKRKGIVEVQLIVGYKGFADLARRTGQVVGLHADVVYDDDELWSFEYGSDMHLRHKPGPRNGKKTHVYCHVKLKDGQAFVVLPWEEVLKIRDKSQGWQTAKRFGKTADSPWAVHEDRMGAKTAVRALANRGEMPLSIEFMDAMEIDDATVDYAAYAKNPSAGAVIEGEAEETAHDPETGEIEKPKPETVIKPAKEATPIKVTQTEDAPTEAKPQPLAADRYVNLRAAILRDLDQSGDTGGVTGFYAEVLEDMAVNAPEMLAEIKAKVAEMEGV